MAALEALQHWASLPVLAGSLIGASFPQTVSNLVVMQGVRSSRGVNLLFAPTVTYLDEWFVRRKGLAIGIMWHVIDPSAGQLKTHTSLGRVMAPVE